MIDAIPSNPAGSIHSGSTSPYFVAPEPRPEHSLLRHKKQQQLQHPQTQQQQQLQHPQTQQQQQLQHPQQHRQQQQQEPPSCPSPPMSPWKSPTVQKKLAASRTLSNQSPVTPVTPKPSSSSSHVFSERLALMSKFFDLCNPCEQVVTMCALAKKMKKRQVKFLNRILDQLMTSDAPNGDDNDDEDGDDDDDILEKEANDPSYLRNLSSLTRNEMITNLLLRFPLLEPGNNSAKQEYLKLIPKAINYNSTDNDIHDHNNNNNNNSNNSNSESFSSKWRQLLTYMCIHPALKRNEFSGFALLLNGSDLFQPGRNSPTVPVSLPVDHDLRQDRHHHCDLERTSSSSFSKWKREVAKNCDVVGVRGRIRTGSDSGNTSDDIGAVSDAGDIARGKEGEAKVAEIDELDSKHATIDEEEKSLTWNHNHYHHHLLHYQQQQQQQQQLINNINNSPKEPRDSCRLSMLSSCSSRDSGISVQFDNLTKRGLASSLSMPASRELPNEDSSGTDLTFADKVKVGLRNGTTFGPNPQGIWNNFGEIGSKGGGFPYLEEKGDSRQGKTVSLVPKIDGHTKLARTVSLVPDWLNKVQTAEEITNPAFRMRLILGPNSSHLPLSPQSSTNSTDSNESQADMRVTSGDGKDSDWSMILSAWLKSLRLHKYTNLLQKLTYDELLSLSEDWLIQRDVTKGARDKLLLNIRKLQERPQQLDAMEESLKNNPDSLQTAIIELTHLLKTPMKRVHDQTWFGHSQRLADRDNLPLRVVNLLGKIRTELLVSKQNHSDSGLCSSFLRLVQGCSSHPCFGEEQRKKLMSWTNQVNKLHISVPLRNSFDRSRNFSYRNSNSRFSGMYRGGGSTHLPLARRSTAMPFSNVIGNNAYAGSSSNNNNNNNNGQQSNGGFSNFQSHLMSGPDFKPKLAVSRTHSAPLDGNVSPNGHPSKNRQMTDKIPVNAAVEDACDSPFDLDPSMEKHALGGMLQDLS